MGDTVASRARSAVVIQQHGMLLLGAIIEKRSGESYFDYVREHADGPPV